ncbi:o-succinylbenzoate synthase [Stigmatella sp. ncwal1]|uniref:o-succinylbenzoate synthase n=1 Tax=Stigmatella ashevillensis TaxID=2995309 RepID=A0ABT5CZZ0_9BACT|nr:o-succinylbenzoate synthase [Stigmatella ashevillena]MDC0706991.1 o-succinylbenzoate synthase [Stigmatella ashevillena]
MRITETRLTPSRLELIRPLKTARATYTLREGFLVQLVDEEGRIGQGEAMPLVEFGTESLGVCQQVLHSHLRGLRDQNLADNLDAIEDAFALPSQGPGQGRVLRLRPTEEIPHAPAADHAVELALLDLLAQRREISLSRLLDRAARAEVLVNALLTAEEPQELAEEARKAVAEGYRTVKLKVAGRPLDEDEARVRAVRQAVGPEVNIRLDANGGWSETEAVHAVDRLGWYGLELCEQPVPPQELRALWRLQRRAPFPLAADEALASPEAIPVLLGVAGGMPAARAFVLKPMVLGGLLPALMFARQAASIGLEAFVTSALDGVVSRAGAAHLAAALPSGRLASGLAVGSLFVREEPVEHPFRPIQGKIRLPDAPGLGLLP